MKQPVDFETAGLEPTPEVMRALVASVAERVIGHLSTLSDQRASDVSRATEVAESLHEPMPERGAALSELLDAIFQRFLPAGYNTASPGTLSFVTGGGLFHAAVADFIALATNPFVAYWAASPAFVEMEHSVVRWFCDLMELPESAGGVLTTGGSIANLIAIITARRTRLSGDFSAGTVYASDAAHHCIQKGMVLAGFPAENLRSIATDREGRIRLNEVEAAIAADKRRRLRPFLLVGMAGTTGTGAIDDLEGLAAIAARERLWFHVDAAYGGFFKLTERGRAALAGAEHADSIVLDPHKSLFMPFGTGCVLVRREDDLRTAHLVHSHCVRDSVEIGERCAARNPADMSPELTRECRALRLWLPLKLLGANAFRNCLDEKLDLAERAVDALSKLGEIEILATGLSTVAFRVRFAGLDAPALDALNREVLRRINQQGRVHLSGVEVLGVQALRICVLAFRTHQRSIEVFLEDLRAAMESLQSETFQLSGTPNGGT